MPIIGAMTRSCKLELLKAIHDFSADTFKMSLYTSAAQLSELTTAYTTSGEVTGSGYTAGGKVIAVADGFPLTDEVSGQAWVRFTETEWPGATFSARGALIYNASKANRSVRVISFGTDASPNNGPFVFEVPLTQPPLVILG